MEPGITMQRIVELYATGIMRADGRRPVAVNRRSGVTFQSGIGPHSESETLRLVIRELVSEHRNVFERGEQDVPYPNDPRNACDLCIGLDGQWEWAIEVKLLRILGDNGKPNDNMLMHILSPYRHHRSAVTDCEKVLRFTSAANRGILIWGYESDRWPLEPAIGAFEALANRNCELGERQESVFGGLAHPVHSHGRVYGWEVKPRA